MSDKSPPEAVQRSKSQRGDRPEWCNKFIRLLHTTTVSEACRRVRIDITTPYKYRKTHPEFARAWAEVTEARDDRMEDTLSERMADGWEEPIFNAQGEQVATKRVYDNRTALKYLQARRPEKWSERRFADASAAEGRQVEIVFRAQPEKPPKTTEDE